MRILNKKSLKILEYFNLNNDRGTLKDIALYLDSPERSLRYEMEKLEEFLNLQKIGTISKVGKGSFEIVNNVAIREYLIDNFFDLFFNEYRNTFILMDISFSGSFNISKVCQKFDISRTTIKNSIQEIKDELSEFNLNLISLPKVGLKLTGDEEDIRSLQLKLFNTFYNNKDKTIENLALSKHITNFICDIDSQSIDHFIKYTTWNLEKIISDEAYSIFRSAIFITIARIKQGHTLSYSPNQNFLSETKEFLAVKDSVSILESNFNIELNEYETYKFTDYLLGSHSYNVNMSYYENWIEIKVLIQKIIRNFDKNLPYDITNDEELLSGLINHIKPSIHRIKNNIQLQNTIYQEVIDEYPEVFNFTKKAIFQLEQYIQNEFDNEETALLALHFKGAIDRNQYQLKTNKNLLIVCGEGLGTSKLIAQQITEKYDVNIIGPLPLNQLKFPINKEEVDLIITTLDETLLGKDVPVIKVKTLINNSDFEKLDKFKIPKYNKKISLSKLMQTIKKGTLVTDEKLLLEELKNCLGDKLINDLKTSKLSIFEMLPIENIRINVSVNSWEEAIKMSGDILYSNGFVSENYGENMVRIIYKYGPYIVAAKNLAIPHAKDNNQIIKTGMSLIVLDTPVYFNESTRVNTILAFSSADNVEHFEGLSSFLDMANSYNFIEKIHCMDSRKKILDEIKKYDFLNSLGKH